MHDPGGFSVTLVSGLPGSGKTSVASLLTGRSPHSAVEPFEGAIDAYGDSGDLAIELAEHLAVLADSRPRSNVVVELHPLTDPAEVGLVLHHMFASRSPHEVTLALKDMITVVRVSHVRRLLFHESKHSADLEDYDTPERLAQQIEFATAIVLTGIEDCPLTHLHETYALIAKLNPRAMILSLATTERLLRRRRRPVTVGELGGSAGWMLELAGRVPPTTVAAISSMVFRDPRPFHPGRLADAVASALEPAQVGLILRSRGLVRLASRPDRVGSWSIAGGILAMNPTEMTSWELDSPLGQEIVFFGLDLDHESIGRVLSSCLLADHEIIAGPMAWAGYQDSFPVWQIDHDH